MNKQSGKRLILSALVCAGTALLAVDIGPRSSQAAAASAPTPDLVALSGNVHPFARAKFDAGEAPASLHMSGLELVYAKTPAQDAALTQLLADQQNPKSANYHRWLTPAEYGARFGANDSVVQAFSNWLKSNGFQVGDLPAGRGHLPFFGSKAQVEAAFHTQIHLYNVNGQQHFANSGNPMVPAALKPLIGAIRGLNDFHPKPGARRVTTAPLGTKLAPSTYYSGSGQYPGYVGPTDFAIMYNLSSAYQQNITGANVTVAIAAQSNINASVLTTFWTAFGVNGQKFSLPAQVFTPLAVPASAGGSDPGETNDGNEDEAYLDTEIVGGLAPGAKIILVRDTSAQTAAQYAIDQNLAAIVNISFSDCESAEGASNSSINSMMKQAASLGITVTVSSGDSGVTECADSGGEPADANGFAVNAIASTPYDLAVGGTDFDPGTESSYWNTSNQSGTLASVISHVPEIAWNYSCANPIYAAEAGYSGDPIAFCNNAPKDYLEISGGGGGVSSCIATDNSGVCNAGYAKPSWQANVAALQSATARAIPDVAMISTRWLVCSYENTTCSAANAPTFSQSNPGTILVFDGTSAASPSVAAIIALVDQSFSNGSSDGRQGLVNPLFYQLAAIEYAVPANLTACNASQGAITASLCVFFDVTSGSIAQPCSPGLYAESQTEKDSAPGSTCGTDSASNATGVMEINGAMDYQAAAGYDLATGLGSINAGALIAAFQSSAIPAPTGLTASASGTTVTLSWSVDSSATNGYDVYQAAAPGPVVAANAIQSNITTNETTVTGLSPGQTYLFAVTAVSTSGIASPLSNQAQATLAPAAPGGVQATAGAAGAISLTWQASSGATSYAIDQGATAATATTKVQSATGTSATISGLTAGQQYFFTVVAIDAGGSSSPSQAVNATVIPAVPASLSATSGNASVSLSWSAATGAASYNVYQGSTAGGEGAQPVMTGVSGTSTSVSGLTNGTKYFFTVRAVDAGGTSGASNEASATPAAPSSGHGGGSMDWLALCGLALLAGCRGARAIHDRRRGPAAAP